MADGRCLQCGCEHDLLEKAKLSFALCNNQLEEINSGLTQDMHLYNITYAYTPFPLLFLPLNYL